MDWSSQKTLIKYWPRLFTVWLIRLYQKTLSPDHGLIKFKYPYGYCRFSPTCSEYSVQAIGKYGFFKGGAKALWRVLRCNPFNKGGNDPIK
jgi:hypothetical protein